MAWDLIGVFATGAAVFLIVAAVLWPQGVRINISGARPYNFEADTDRARQIFEAIRQVR